MTANTEPVSAPAIGNPVGATILGSDAIGATRNFLVTDVTPVFASLALAAATVISPQVGYIHLQGYATAGDGGAADYVRIESQPSYAGKFQSADGGWWRISGNSLSAKALGAKGDGATNDSTAVQNVINTANSLLIPKVFFPKGTYCLRKVHLRSNITYDLGGAEVLADASSQIGEATLEGNNESNITVTGGVVDGNINVVPGSPSSGVTSLQSLSSTGLTVVGVVFQNNKYLAISASAMSGLTVANCQMNNTDCGIITQQNCHNVNIYGNHIDSGTSDGIAIWGNSSSANSSDIRIYGNFVSNKTGGNGIIIKRANGFTVTGNVLYNCTFGVNINPDPGETSYSYDGSIVGNSFNTMGDSYAIGGHLSKNITISGNSIYNCTDCGIWVNGWLACAINDNVIMNINSSLTDSAAIRVQSGNRIRVSNNLIDDDRGSPLNYAGVQIATGGSSNFVTGTVCRNTTFPILIASGANLTSANGNYCNVTDQGTNSVVDGNYGGTGGNVTASSTTITIGDAPGNFFTVLASGAQLISTINGGFDGKTIRLLFSRADTTMDNGGNILLAGGALTSAVNGTMSLSYKGSKWYELGRCLTNT